MVWTLETYVLEGLVAWVAFFGPNATLMDKRGPDWCEAHLEEIIGWLREEAQRAHLPFVDLAGRILIRRAIKLSRVAAVDTPE